MKRNLISELIEQLEHLQEADDLLSKIWLALGGPYGGILDGELQRKLNSYMGFDDSE